MSAMSELSDQFVTGLKQWVELDNKIKIVKVNVDENNQTAVKFSIRSIPTLMMIKDGEVQAQHIGAASKSQIKEFINQNI